MRAYIRPGSDTLRHDFGIRYRVPVVMAPGAAPDVAVITATFPKREEAVGEFEVIRSRGWYCELVARSPDGEEDIQMVTDEVQ